MYNTDSMTCCCIYSVYFYAITRSKSLITTLLVTWTWYRYSLWCLGVLRQKLLLWNILRHQVLYSTVQWIYVHLYTKASLYLADKYFDWNQSINLATNSPKLNNIYETPTSVVTLSYRIIDNLQMLYTTQKWKTTTYKIAAGVIVYTIPKVYRMSYSTAPNFLQHKMLQN